MGSSSSKNLKSKNSLFQWKNLEVPQKKDCDPFIHYDPRYESISFHNDSILISDMHNRVFKWDVVNNTADEQKNTNTNTNNNQNVDFRFADIHQYKFQQNQVGRRFDRSGNCLTWIDVTCNTIYYFETSTQTLYSYDITNWLAQKYGENIITKIPSKQTASPGNGSVIFMLNYQNKNKESNSPKQCDIVHMNVIEKREVNTVTVDCALLKQEKCSTVYWGFMLHPNQKTVTMVIERKKGNLKLNVLLFVSLRDGSIMWQSQFDFVHDLSFSADGTYICIFERPRTTEYGYVHVMNFSRLQWLCQLEFRYGSVPLGWDAFTWCGNCLVFVKPFGMTISAPGDLHFRQNLQTRKINQILQLEEEQRRKAMQLLFSDNADDDEDEPVPVPNQKKVVLSPNKFDELAQHQKSQKICVLSIADRWWDLNRDTMDLINRQVCDENIAHLILEYASLSWVTVEFPYPTIDNSKSKNKTQMALLQGAMSEVFESGSLTHCNVLMLGQIARHPKTRHFNHWKFRVCVVPKTFAEMWANPVITTGIIGNGGDAQ